MKNSRLELRNELASCDTSRYARIFYLAISNGFFDPLIDAKLLLNASAAELFDACCEA